MTVLKLFWPLVGAAAGLAVLWLAPLWGKLLFLALAIQIHFVGRGIEDKLKTLINWEADRRFGPLKP